MKRIIIIYGLLLAALCLYAQENSFNPETVIEKGILGTYTLKESFDWYDNADKKIFREDITFQPSKADFNQAKQELMKYFSKEDFDYLNPAIFYIVSDKSDTIKLYGLLDYDDSSAYMYLTIPNTVLSKIKSFSPATLVFAIDEKNDAVWHPLKYFNYMSEEEDSFAEKLNNKFITTFSCNSGIYTLRYKPTEKEIEAIGDEVYYMTKEDVKNIMNQKKSTFYDSEEDVNIIDFLIPEKPYNKAMYYVIDSETNKKTGIKRIVSFDSVQNQQYKISATLYMDNMPTAMTVENLILSENAVKRIYHSFENPSFGIPKKEYTFQNSNIVLKLPKLNQIEKWNYIDEHGEKIECEAIYKKEIIAGEHHDVLKKTEKLVFYSLVHQKNETKIKEYYYVKKRGLWKTNLKDSSGKFIPYEELDRIDYDKNIDISNKNIEESNNNRETNKEIPNYEEPEFIGGETEMWRWINSHLKYPVLAAEQGIQGKVVVMFTVQQDGSLTDVKIKKSLDPSCDKEVVRMVKSMPKWNPKRENGVAIESPYTLPVNFKLTGYNDNSKKKKK